MHRLFGTLGHGDLCIVSWRCFQLCLTLLLPNWDISILLYAASVDEESCFLFLLPEYGTASIVLEELQIATVLCIIPIQYTTGPLTMELTDSRPYQEHPPALDGRKRIQVSPSVAKFL